MILSQYVRAFKLTIIVIIVVVYKYRKMYYIRPIHTHSTQS